MDTEDFFGIMAGIGLIMVLIIFGAMTYSQQETQKNFMQICNKLDGIVILVPTGLECVSRSIVIEKK